MAVSHLFPVGGGQSTLLHQLNGSSQNQYLQLFPQFFHKSYGFIQANTLMNCWGRRLRMVNARVSNPPNTPLEDEEDFNSGQLHDDLPITGDFCQIYSESAHHFRHRVSTHDAQRGHLTAYAGSFFARPTEESKARAAREHIRNGRLPYNRFIDVLSTNELNRNLRCEHVYTVKMEKLHCWYKNAE
jgi:hypothetical protein